ncbi:MAG: sensor histidine kinase [Gammaproteobacteria bacterium]
MAAIKPNFKGFLERSTQLRGLALLGLLLLAFTILAGMIWRNLARLDRVHAYVSYSHRIQDSASGLHKILVDFLSDARPLDPIAIEALDNQVRQLSEHDYHLSSETPFRLISVADGLRRLAQNNESPWSVRNELLQQFAAMNGVLDQETVARDKLLETISNETRIELWMAGMILALVFAVMIWILRKRVIAPLHDLKELLLRLTREDYAPIDTQHTDPLLLPVYTNYNVMVRHLADLQAVKRHDAAVLQAEVRSATRAVLEQQRSLAKAERLAAVGELAAGLAHELRNPLAGVSMSCANLRAEITNPDQAERLDHVNQELKRMATLLNALLTRSRQAPPDSTRFSLAEIVADLLALTRYQVSPDIELALDIPDEIECVLPESHLRQALLNLILNAAQAIGDSPGRILLNAREEEDVLSISVLDTGPGFSAELLREGIRSFHTTRSDGTGLGLAIVQRFVRDIGGKIKLRNLEPHGGCVTLEIPEIEIA